MEESAAVHGPLPTPAESGSRLDDWARRAALGDRVAFEAIYDETAVDILSYLSSITRHSPIAEDLAANVFLKAWRSARSYRGGSNTYRQWLFAIARNELADYWRTRRSDVPLDAVDVEDTNAEMPGEDTGIHDRMVEALQTLTPEQRDVVVMRYFMDRSYAEIAVTLGKREGAVRALLMRALRQMRKVVEHAAQA